MKGEKTGVRKEKEKKRRKTSHMKGEEKLEGVRDWPRIK